MSRLSDSVIEDHRELADYYNRITSSKDHDEQVRYQNMFIWELARHSVAEEIVIYPILEEKVTGGKYLAQKDREEHQKAKEMLYKFQKMTPKDADFIPTLDSLFSDLKGHIKDEEEKDLPKLEDVMSKEDSEGMAKSFERTKMFAPTQSHPSAPNKPPFETAVGLLTAPIDKVMDAFKRFPKD